jgi:hypothetical protein
MAADASVFTFGDDEDYESDWARRSVDVFLQGSVHKSVC